MRVTVDVVTERAAAWRAGRVPGVETLGKGMDGGSVRFRLAAPNGSRSNAFESLLEFPV